MWKRKTNAKVKELNQPRQNVLFLEFTMETRACLNRDFGSKALERRLSGLQLFSYSYLEVLSVSMFARLLRESVTVACWSPKVTFSIIDYIKRLGIMLKMRLIYGHSKFVDEFQQTLLLRPVALRRNGNCTNPIRR